MNHKVQRRFTYDKESGTVEDTDGRGYFAHDHSEMIILLHHLSGRNMGLEPIHDLINQYVHSHDLV
jgi:hypothetical protein